MALVLVCACMLLSPLPRRSLQAEMNARAAALGSSNEIGFLRCQGGDIPVVEAGEVHPCEVADSPVAGSYEDISAPAPAPGPNETPKSGPSEASQAWSWIRRQFRTYWIACIIILALLEGKVHEFVPVASPQRKWLPLVFTLVALMYSTVFLLSADRVAPEGIWRMLAYWMILGLSALDKRPLVVHVFNADDD